MCILLWFITVSYCYRLKRVDGDGTCQFHAAALSERANAPGQDGLKIYFRDIDRARAFELRSKVVDELERMLESGEMIMDGEDLRYWIYMQQEGAEVGESAEAYLRRMRSTSDTFVA